jgi:hypothetical protein
MEEKLKLFRDLGNAANYLEANKKQWNQTYEDGNIRLREDEIETARKILSEMKRNILSIETMLFLYENIMNNKKNTLSTGKEKKDIV